MLKEEEFRKKIKLLKRFYLDIVNYIIVNGILILIWLTFDKTGTFWPKYVLLIWGILLIFKGYRMGVMPLIFPGFSFLNRDWEEKKVKELMRKQNSFHKSSSHKSDKEK